MHSNPDGLVARFINEARATKTAVIVFYAVMKSGKPIMRMRSSSASPEAAMRFVLQIDDHAVEAAAQSVYAYSRRLLTDKTPWAELEEAIRIEYRAQARVALEAGRDASGARLKAQDQETS